VRPNLIFLILTACGAAAPPPPTATKAALAGPRCQGGGCTCRSKESGDAEEAAPGKRRYEFRVESAPGVAWVTVDDNQLYAPEATPSCFYLDLAPGDHKVKLGAAASADPGVVGATMSVAEHNPKGPWWYDVFSFACGNPGACTVETMKQWKKEVVADRKGLTDPCSGTRITGLDYTFGHMPGNDAAKEVAVTFQLHVKPKSLDLAPRSEECPEK
jgi:hypothetical protein